MIDSSSCLATQLNNLFHHKISRNVNGPQMHLWHHVKDMPATHPFGFNYGITLSVWDYLFKTNHWPSDNENLPVGLPDKENFPEDFVGQTIRPFQRIFEKK